MNPSKLISIARVNQRLLSGSLIATIIVTLLTIFPEIRDSMSLGFLVVFPFGFIWIFFIYVAYTMLALMLGLIIGISFYLLRIKNSLFIAGVGSPVSFLAASLINELTGLGGYIKALLVFSVVYILFYTLMYITSRHKIGTVAAGMLFLILVSAYPYGVLYIERIADIGYVKTQNSEFRDKQNRIFEEGKKNVDFTVYYPAHQSTKLPASVPKLNGYSQTLKHVDLHVTYTIGRARVMESGLIKDQEKLMDFNRNCDITRLGSIMDRGEVTTYDIDKSLENLQRCNIIHTAKDGEKVYIRESGQFTAFYLKKGTTNILIRFDDINTEEYNDAILPEVKRIIDSLKPYETNKLQKGSASIANYR